MKMSTDYYGFREPITSIRPKVLGGHTHVGIWVNHAKAGTLVFRNEEWKEAIWLFVDEDISMMHTFFGGKEMGTVVIADVPELQSERMLISERGEICEVGEIWSHAGEGRNDPT